jgi:hypothetical protein
MSIKGRKFPDDPTLMDIQNERVKLQKIDLFDNFNAHISKFNNLIL